MGRVSWVEVACTCDGLPAHSHRATGRTVPGSLIEKGPFAGTRFERVEYDPFDIRLWIDWRAVAEALAAEVRDELPASDVASGG